MLLKIYHSIETAQTCRTWLDIKVASLGDAGQTRLCSVAHGWRQVPPLLSSPGTSARLPKAEVVHVDLGSGDQPSVVNLWSSSWQGGLGWQTVLAHAGHG